MALNKTPLTINFAQGLNTKTDPIQVAVSQFLNLQNSVFDTGGLLQKRNGFGQLTSLPNTSSSFVTTFNGNLTALGSNIFSLSQGDNKWVTRTQVTPVSLSTQPQVRSNTQQTYADSVMSPNGLVCTVFTDNVPVSGSLTTQYKYTIADSATGQNVVASTLIPAGGHTITGSPRVFCLGSYFVLVFGTLISATNHLQYIAISTSNPTTPTAPADISAQYSPKTPLGFDGVVANNTLYVAWNGSDGGGAVRIALLTSNLVSSSPVVFSGKVGTMFGVAADVTQSTPVIYVSFYDSVSQAGYVLAVSPILTTVLAPTQIIAGQAVDNITVSAQNAVCTVYYEVDNNYAYDTGLPTHYLEKLTVTQAGTVSSTTVLARSVGLASKAFLYDGVSYVLTSYQSVFQPSYYLLNSTGAVIVPLAYQNGGGYLTAGLPSASVIGSTVSIPYRYKDLIASVNKTLGVPNAAGVYSQTGINLASFDFTTSGLDTSELGSNLNITTGFTAGYDGNVMTEMGFFVYPDNVEATWSASGGSIHAEPDGSTNNNAYAYQALYEWTDNQGNIQRSAPSIPIQVTTTGSGTAGSIAINVPTLRLTYKTANPVKIVIYRWSVANQIFYQVTSVTNPLLNDPTVDYVTFTDTQADASIIGNSIIYTTGGVVENIVPPSSNICTIFDTRYWLVDAEDPNVLWYSKQVIEGTPVEMSDLFTIYISPTISAQGATGPTTALSAMDDKLIIFKRDAIYYLNGSGPDNTGANSQYSQPIFITSTVGCTNPRSLVLMPSGLMFQSDKGIWLLGRDMSTNYIGAAVEAYNDATVTSAVAVPGTNQVRFTLGNNTTLMYDYYYSQWGTFTNTPAASSTLYNHLHTYITASGSVFQETPGLYVDGASPVLLSFTTGWANMAGVQGYQRAYYFYLLGTYQSPHKLSVGVAYDYASSPSQITTIAPDNFNANWGGEAVWGSGGNWGGNPQLEQWRIFLQQQKCQALQVTVTETYDGSYGVAPGAGVSISGLTFVIGAKKAYPVLRPSRSVG